MADVIGTGRRVTVDTAVVVDVTSDIAHPDIREGSVRILIGPSGFEHNVIDRVVAKVLKFDENAFPDVEGVGNNHEDLYEAEQDH